MLRICKWTQKVGRRRRSDSSGSVSKRESEGSKSLSDGVLDQADALEKGVVYT